LEKQDAIKNVKMLVIVLEKAKERTAALVRLRQGYGGHQLF